MKLKTKNKSNLIGLIGILVIGIITFLGFNQYKKVNIENFQAKFLACMELELDTLYDKINGISSQKEYVDEMRVHLQNYKDIKKGMPSDFKKEYEEFLEVMNSNIVNYADVNMDTQNEEVLKKSNLIDKFNEVNEKRNINIDNRNKKVDKYIEKFTDK